MLSQYIIWILFLSCIFLLGLTIHLRRFRTVPAAQRFSVIGWLAFAWTLIYIPNLAVSNELLKYTLAQLQMVPAIFIAPAILAFSLEYTGKRHWLTPNRVMIGLFVPILAILGLLTSELHELFRHHFTPVSVGPYSLLASQKGPLFWALLVYSTILILFALAILLTSFNVKTLYWRHTILIAAGLAFPFVVNILYNLKITPIPNLDLTPAAFILTGGLYIWALQGFHLFEIMPIARHAVMDNISDLVIVLDRTGRIIDCNHAARETCHLATPDIGTTPDKLPQPWGDFFKRHADTNYSRTEIHLDIDGRICHYDMSISPIRDNQKQSLGRLFILHDITERKMAESRLDESEKRYRLLAENILDVIWILDLETNRFRYVSPSVEHLRGYTPEEVMAQDISESLTPASLALVQTVLPARLEPFLHGEEQPTYYTDELEQPCKNGSTVWTETITRFFHNPDTGHIDVYGVSRNISQRKLAEEALRQSEDRFAKAFRISPAALVISKRDTAEIIDVNNAFCQITGYSREELLGNTTIGLDMWADADDRAVLMKAVQTEGHARNLETLTRRKNGETRNILLSMEPINIDNMPCFITLGLDITELKALQEHERELAAIKTRQELARDLHDAVSQTLFSARLTAEMLIRRKEIITSTALWDGIEHFQRLVVSALGEMRILLLELRPEGLEQTGLPTLLEHLADATNARIEARITRKIEGGPKLPVDVKTAIYRIAQECLNNIVKHANATEISIALTQTRAGVEMCIEDNGRGFEPQTQTGDHFGLGIMKERAGEIGATLIIESQPAQGTRLTCSWKNEPS